MSYDVIHAVYGIPLSWQFEDLRHEDEHDKYFIMNYAFEKGKIPGLLKYDCEKSTSYSFAFGIELKQFSSFAHHGNIQLAINDDIKTQFAQLFHQLDKYPEIKAIIEAFGDSRISLVWSTFNNVTENPEPFEKEQLENKRLYSPFKY